MLINIPRVIAVHAVQNLALVDYSVATRTSEIAAQIVQWADVHDQWWLATTTLNILSELDKFGSMLIQICAWLVMNAN